MRWWKHSGAACAFFLGLSVQPAIAQYGVAISAERFDWSGFYAGVDSGYAWGRTSFVRKGYTPSTPPGPPPPLNLQVLVDAFRAHSIAHQQNSTVDINGGQAAPRIGYQQQFGTIVIGLEAGIAIGGGSGRRSCSDPSFSLNGAALNVTCETEYKHSADIRGRLGFVTGNWLWYATAGVVHSKIEQSVHFSGLGSQFSERGNSGPNGFIGGLGFEFQAGGMRLGASWTRTILEDVTTVTRDSYGGASISRYRNDPDVLGAALKVPLQQQQTQTADAGPPAAQQQTVQQQAQVQQPAAQQQRPAAQRPPAAGSSAPSAPPAARSPIPGQPSEPDEAPVKGRPSK